MSNATAMVKSVGDMLEARKEAIQAACMKGLDAGTLINLARAVVSRSPEIAACTPVTILQAVMFAAEHGLRLGSLGHLYIVPFKNRDTGNMEATPIIGYRGLIELATRDGRVKSVEARLVYRDDQFHIRLGTDSAIEHVPAWDGPRGDGDCLGAYCVVTMADGTKVFDYMTRRELDAIEEKAKTKKVWGPYKAEMRRKTVTRRTLKYVPVGLALAAAQAEEDVRSGVIDIELVPDVPETAAPRKASATEKLAAKVARSKEAPVSDEPEAEKGKPRRAVRGKRAKDPAVSGMDAGPDAEPVTEAKSGDGDSPPDPFDL